MGYSIMAVKLTYAFFLVDEEIKEYCVNNLELEYHSKGAFVNPAWVRISTYGKYVFISREMFSSSVTQRPPLAKEEFFNILLITDVDARSTYIGQLYKEQFEALRQVLK